MGEGDGGGGGDGGLRIVTEMVRLTLGSRAAMPAIRLLRERASSTILVEVPPKTWTLANAESDVRDER